MWRLTGGATGFAALLMVFSLAPPAAQAASTRPPKTVLDYFLLLPDKYFEVTRGRGERLRWLRDTHSTVDVRHGYLSMNGDGAQAGLELCLFRRPEGSYLVAVSGNL